MSDELGASLIFRWEDGSSEAGASASRLRIALTRGLLGGRHSPDPAANPGVPRADDSRKRWTAVRDSPPRRAMSAVKRRRGRLESSIARYPSLDGALQIEDVSRAEAYPIIVTF
jgi:hypothetical protein